MLRGKYFGERIEDWVSVGGRGERTLSPLGRREGEKEEGEGRDGGKEDGGREGGGREGGGKEEGEREEGEREEGEREEGLVLRVKVSCFHSYSCMHCLKLWLL